MQPDLQRRIQRYGWDKAAPYYETGWQEQLWPAQESLLAEADPQKGEKVLDISCGTGLVTMPMGAIVGPNGSVTGVDLSEGMIEKAQIHAKEKNVQNIRFLHMDAETLDLPDDSFDLIICSLGLMYYPYPQKAMGEMFRVLKPNGRAAVLVWGERKACGWAAIFPIVDRRVQSDVCPLFFQLGTDNALANAFETVGFTQILSKRFTAKLHFKNEKQACTAAFLGGAVALAYQKFDDQTKAEVCREYLDSIKSFRDGRRYHVPGEFVIARGLKPREQKE